MTIRSAAVVALCLCGGVTAACDGGPTAPTALEEVPTPARTVPPEAFPLPSDAPAEAAAPLNTARVTITAIEIEADDGTRVAPDNLQRGIRYRVSMWVFVPRGLEGPLNFDMQGAGRVAGIDVMFAAGYTRRDFLRSSVFSAAGSFPLSFGVSKNFVTLASKQIVLVVR